MGSTPSSEIFYGFYVDDERVSIIRQNLTLPDGDYNPDNVASLYGVDILKIDWKQRKKFLLENVPVGVIDAHNDLYDNPPTIVAVRESIQTIWLIDKIDPTKFVKQDGWDELLIDFCRRINIDCPQDKIGFWCMSNYG